MGRVRSGVATHMTGGSEEYAFITRTDQRYYNQVTEQSRAAAVPGGVAPGSRPHHTHNTHQ
ncbi:hypothetical protein J6590_071082 [Homalodisca vitripennis]|nr:hypothetical protein J6590_071082 [Homalodisca vitripennis]